MWTAEFIPGVPCMDEEIRSLEALFDRIRAIDGDRDPVTLEDILQEIGRRSFAPILLVAGLITLAPLIGDIPGVPTLMAVLVTLTSGQILLGRRQIWLPGFLLNRSVWRKDLYKALDRLEKPAKFIDRFFYPRLAALTSGTGAYVVAAASILIALIMPVLEFIPFSATVAGLALTAFGLSLLSRDGYLALFSLSVTAAVMGTALYHIL
ncbi:MAG: exopolysaccharide biosynthesis protein [Wenzhouxiangellaceae bacterium]